MGFFDNMSAANKAAILIIIFGFIVLLFFSIPYVYDKTFGYIIQQQVYAQSIVNGSGSGSNNLVTEGEVQSMDITNDATVATVGGGIASGLVAEFLARRKKTGKIDAALKDKDMAIFEYIEARDMVDSRASQPGNETLTYAQLLALPAFPEKGNLDKRSLGEYLHQKYLKRKEYHIHRYTENPK